MNNRTSVELSTSTNDSITKSMTENFVIGSLYLSFGLISFILLSCCFYIMLSRKEVFETNSSRQYNTILQQIVLADIIQAFFSGIITGLFVMSPYLQSIQWLSTLCGALAYGAWFLYSFSANLLAFNRFVHIWHSAKVGQIFSKQLTKVYLEALYIYCIIWILVLMSPPINIQFNADLNTYVCSKNDKNCFWMSRFALVFDWFNVACICIFYSLICFKVRKEINNQNQTLGLMNSLKSEAKVVYQSLLICSAPVIYIFIFFLPIDVSKLVMEMNHLVWIFVSGINSLVLLTVNSTMKEQIRLLFGWKSTNRVTIMSIRTNN